MRISLNPKNINILKEKGFEVFSSVSSLSADFTFSSPSGTKFSDIDQCVEIDAFSYCVSGYLCGVKIGRYCSFGENVQIGRQSHPIDWVSTSPFTYMNSDLILPMNTMSRLHYIQQIQPLSTPPTNLKRTTIGNDVWIGQGAMILPGVNIGTGAIIAAGSVITKDVTPYSIMGGNPATIIRYRIPFELIAEILASEWWKYSPADLNSLPVWSPIDFLKEFNKIKNNLIPYSKEHLKVGDLIA